AAAAVAAAVAALAGGWWGLGAGLAAAAYRPFLVHAGVHEPETAIVFCLAVAVFAGVLARKSSGKERRSWRWSLVAGLSLGAAALLRPQHLLLVPIWALWIGAARPRETGASGRRSSLPSLFVLLAALAVVAPFSLARWRATGSLAVMNPGPVFYEGNGPGALGLRRWAPAAVLALERMHPQASDYGHVAYRRIAAAALGRPVTPAESNRYWSGLARQTIAAWPGRAAARGARKALFAVMPYEAHDLVVAEHLDRRLRARLPWGFALLAVALPWTLLARRDRLADLAGPLAIAALAAAVQVAFYASARQRLPPALGVLLGLVVAGALAAASGRWAGLDQLEWDETLGRRPASPPEDLLALQEGRIGRAALREDALLFRAALARHRAGRHRAAIPAFAVLAGRDFTIDEDPVGLPEHWLARCHLFLGDGPRARAVLDRVLASRPDDPRLRALAARLGASRRRPPGVDPATWRLLLSGSTRAPRR
ncbi:MAG TPA: tetratricopeptide repeat protein, partial [Thermoanaerobaculia bacterium]|nr:tetratricopeptide repeat protein [Thermoanaerobaculia bacterium]